jgi:hypothetical protein
MARPFLAVGGALIPHSGISEAASASDLHRSFELPTVVSPEMPDLQCHGIREDVSVPFFDTADNVGRSVLGRRLL